MTMCEPLLQNDCVRTELEELILLAVDFLVRMCPVQGIKQASSTPTVASLEAGCGGKCFASLSTSKQDGYWQKMYGTYSALPMFQDEKEEHSDEYSKTWPRMGMMLHGFVMVLPTLARHIKGTEYSSWPTPRANDTEKRGANIANDIRNGLPAAVKYWGTPKASDYKGSCKFGSARQQEGIKRGNLMEQVMQSNNTGQLNADWVEILMGSLIGWTNIDCDDPQDWPGWPAPLSDRQWMTPKASEGGLVSGRTKEQSTFLSTQVRCDIPQTTGQYPYEPPRVITGQKNRAKRLKCLGNAVVPQQIYPIFAAIAEIEKARG